MRALLIGLGLAGLFATGCGSSGTVDGGTTTGGGTTGGTTTAGTTTAGTTTTTSTGGTTTTGTGGLPAGATCSSDTACNSNICGVTGTGHCCTAVCSTTDQTCGASGCDDTGACTYPATSVTCGTVSCNAGMLTASACNGSGACVAGTPTACPGHFGCNSAGMSCNTTCTVAGDCASGFYCNGGSCAATETNGACTSNAACTSGICGLSGTGNCCTTQCTAASDMACDPGCDVTTGACTYPAGNACGAAATCTGSMLTASACDATGACNLGAPVPCANNFGCNAAGTACNTTCTVVTDCASGFWCSANACVPQLATGPCTENDTCLSGACGTSGSGNCCTAACTLGGKTCGATGCDATGACMYPPAMKPCGSTSCTNGVLTDSACDGAGTCVSNGGVACLSGNCDPAGTTCSCTTNSDCSGKAGLCDVLNGVCCPGIASSGTMSVDSANGSDTTACCGYAGVGACQTLTQAMKLINASQSQNVTITATVFGAGGNWASAGEVYPISLGWGVTLAAPGVYFTDTGSNPEIFDIALGTGETSPGQTVTIEGTPATKLAASPVTIGSDNLGTLTSDTNSIVVEANETLNLNSVNVYEASGATGVWVSDGGSTLELDNAGAGGVLQLGGNLPNGTAVTSNMGTGILCAGTLTDANATAGSSLLGEGQNISIDAEDNCSLTLIDFPTFGWPNNGGGYTNAGQGCTGNPTPMDNTGVLANGSATVSLGGTTITCMSNAGIVSSNSNGEATTPTVNLSNVTIENCAVAGIHATAGSVTVQSGTIDHNFIGVWQASDSSGSAVSVTLNDGTGTVNTTVDCNSNQETGGANPGIDVYNTSLSSLAADDVAWDTTSPDYFSCDSDSSTATCTCLIASCSNTAPFDDMDAVEDSTNLGGITTTGNTQSPNACN